MRGILEDGGPKLTHFGQNRPKGVKKGSKKGSKMAILAQKSGQKTVREWAFTYYISALGIWPKTPILGVKIPHFWTKNGSFLDPFFDRFWPK